MDFGRAFCSGVNSLGRQIPPSVNIHAQREREREREREERIIEVMTASEGALESRGTAMPNHAPCPEGPMRAISRGQSTPGQHPNTNFGQGELPYTHARALTFLSVEGVQADSHSFGRAAATNVPNGQFLFLSLGMFSCAHVRANYFSIGRVFDCSRQSSSVSRSTKQARHVRLFGRYHNLCPHLGREKSGSGKRGERRSARPPVGRIMH